MIDEGAPARHAAALPRRLGSAARSVFRKSDPNRPTNARPTLNVYQYWDLPQPPADVMENIRATQAAMPDARMTLLNKSTAERLIAFHHGARALAAFRACGPPAMQADYLRLCILDSLGGLYLDVDEVVLKPLDGLIDDVPGGLVFKWLVTIGNGVLYFRTAKHPFIRACLELATENIEARRFGDVLLSTGPGLITAIYCAGDQEMEDISKYILSHSSWDLNKWAELLTYARGVKAKLSIRNRVSRDLKVMDVTDYMGWIENRNMIYKSTPIHWENWIGDIYA